MYILYIYITRYDSVCIYIYKLYDLFVQLFFYNMDMSRYNYLKITDAIGKQGLSYEW